MNRDHSVLLEIASKYCISNSSVDHHGYSISSDGFLPHAREEVSYPTSEVRGKQRRVPGCDHAGTVERRYPTPEARGGGREKQPHLQVAVATRAQENLGELFHAQGQKGQR